MQLREKFKMNFAQFSKQTLIQLNIHSPAVTGRLMNNTLHTNKKEKKAFNSSERAELINRCKIK